MKKIASIVAGIVFLAGTAFAGGGTKEETTIKTSAQCGMCKVRIEKAVKKVKGVTSVDLDVKTKLVKVSYIKEKTSAEKIREAISNTGYDADEVKANEKAYEKLHGCCKKPS